MAKNSTRKEIFNILCDKNIFPVGYSGYSWDYAEIIKKHLAQQTMDSVKDIDNSIREVLETVDGYTYTNGTKCFPKMNMNKIQIPKKDNPNKYNVLYQVI